MVRIDGYEHAAGNHCGSTSLRNLAAFYGWGPDDGVYDEPTCFGLAEGLGFTYFELPESPWRAFFGRPLWLETAFFENLAIPVEHREGDEFEDAWASIRGRIDADRPVMVFTDIYYLDYYDSSTHFAPHSLLAVGYEPGSRDERPDAASGGPDPEDDVVYLSDSEFERIQRLPVTRLRAAMTSTHVLPLESRWLSVTDPDPGRAFAPAARRATERTARYLLDPADGDRPTGPGTHGVDGIRAFARELPTYLELADPGWAVRFAYQNVERRGTGGGAFRRMYADYLATASGAVSAIPGDAGERMRSIADAWTDVGEALRAISERDDEAAMREGLEATREDVLAIADREEALFGDLLDALA